MGHRRSSGGRRNQNREIGIDEAVPGTDGFISGQYEANPKVPNHQLLSMKGADNDIISFPIFFYYSLTNVR